MLMYHCAFKVTAEKLFVLVPFLLPPFKLLRTIAEGKIGKEYCRKEANIGKTKRKRQKRNCWTESN